MGKIKNAATTDLPGDPVAKTLCSQYRGTGFDPWSGNWTPHATFKSSPAAAKTQHTQINRAS